MKRLFAFLTGFALLSQAGSAQGGISHSLIFQRLFPSLIRAPGEPDSAKPASVKSGSVNQAVMKACCQKIMKDGQHIFYLNSRNGKMKLQVRGIYVRSATLFFSLRLINCSPLDYEVDSLRFFLVRKQGKPRSLERLAVLSPVFVYDSVRLIRGYGRAASVVAIPRLSLAKGQRLLVEVLEKNGGRQLQVQANHFTLENARLI